MTSSPQVLRPSGPQALKPSSPHAVVFIAIAAVVGLAAWLASSLSGMPLVGYDDANIFFVYARNLVDGHGFVYNAGGERVEGFTSLAWVLICALARAITTRYEVVLFAINVVVVAFALSRLCALSADLLTRYDVAERARATWLAVALALVVAVAPSYVIWSVVSLMDSGLWAALLLLAAVATVRLAVGDAIARGGRMLPALMIALVLTRPESLLWGPVFLVLWIGAAIANGTSVQAALKQHAGAALAFAASVAGLFAWRLIYFGYPLPNTYYAKGGDPIALRLESGVMYLWDFAAGNPAFLLAVAAGIAGTVALLVRSRRARDDERAFRLLLAQLCVIVMLLVGAAIPVIEGGDHFGFWRMYQPIVPLVAIQAALSAALLALVRPAERHAAAAACLIVIVFALSPWRHWASLGEVSYQSAGIMGHGWNTARLEIAIADDMRGIGRAFNRAFPQQPPSVGVIVAGGFALEYHGPTIDLMGLNNVAMAHSRAPRRGVRNHMAFDPEVFFTLAPDVVLLSMWAPQRPDWFKFPMLSGAFDAPPYGPGYFERRGLSMNNFDAGVLKGLLHQQRTADLYQWAAVRPSGGTGWIHAIFRKAFLQELTARSYEIALPGPPK